MTEKHHQCKLQSVRSPWAQVGVGCCNHMQLAQGNRKTCSSSGLLCCIPLLHVPCPSTTCTGVAFLPSISVSTPPPSAAVLTCFNLRWRCVWQNEHPAPPYCGYVLHLAQQRFHCSWSLQGMEFKHTARLLFCPCARWRSRGQWACNSWTKATLKQLACDTYITQSSSYRASVPPVLAYACTVYIMCTYVRIGHGVSDQNFHSQLSVPWGKKWPPCCVHC